MPSQGLLKYIETKAVDHLLLPHTKIFYRTKGSLELGSHVHFLHDFWRNIFTFFVKYLTELEKEKLKPTREDMNLKEQNSNTYLEIIGQPGQEKKGNFRINVVKIRNMLWHVPILLVVWLSLLREILGYMNILIVC